MVFQDDDGFSFTRGNAGNMKKDKMRDPDDPNYSQFKQDNATYALQQAARKFGPGQYTLINTMGTMRDDRGIAAEEDTFNVVSS